MNTLILTFNSLKIPESLKICYLNILVSQFVPNSLRCYKCQKFGHVWSDAWKLVIRMIRVPKLSNVLTAENVILHIARNAVFIKGSMTFSQSECPRIFLFFEARTIYQKTHGYRVMSYAGDAKALIQSTSVRIHTYHVD